MFRFIVLSLQKQFDDLVVQHCRYQCSVWRMFCMWTDASLDSFYLLARPSIWYSFQSVMHLEALFCWLYQGLVRNKVAVMVVREAQYYVHCDIPDVNVASFPVPDRIRRAAEEKDILDRIFGSFKLSQYFQCAESSSVIFNETLFKKFRMGMRCMKRLLWYLLRS